MLFHLLCSIVINFASTLQRLTWKQNKYLFIFWQWIFQFCFVCFSRAILCCSFLSGGEESDKSRKLVFLSTCVCVLKPFVKEWDKTDSIKPVWRYPPLTVQSWEVFADGWWVGWSNVSLSIQGWKKKFDKPVSRDQGALENKALIKMSPSIVRPLWTQEKDLIAP